MKSILIIFLGINKNIPQSYWALTSYVIRLIYCLLNFLFIGSFLDPPFLSAIHLLLPCPQTDKILILITDLLAHNPLMVRVLLPRTLKRCTSYTFICGEFLRLLKLSEDRGLYEDPKNLMLLALVLKMLLWGNESCLCCENLPRQSLCWQKPWRLLSWFLLLRIFADKRWLLIMCFLIRMIINLAPFSSSSWRCTSETWFLMTLFVH